MSEDATLDEFMNAEREDATDLATDSDTLDQEQFGPFTLSTPGEWSAKRLGDIKKLITRGKQPTYDDDGIPVINQECIYWDGWHFENLRYLDENVGGDWKDKYFPERGDVILNSTGQGTLGRAQVYPDNQRRAIDSHVTLLRTEEELNPYFHRYFLESHLGQALLYSMCVNGSTGQIELSKTRLDLLPVPLPPLPEQRKISTVLYTVDRAIEKAGDIIAQISTVKEGIKDDLLTGGLRDAETAKIRLGPVSTKIPTHWDTGRIGDLFTHRQLGTDERGTTEDGENIDLIKMGNLDFGTWDLSEVEKIEKDTQLLEEVGLQRGDLLFNTRNTPELVGKTAVWEFDHEAVYDNNLLRLRFGEDLSSGHFVNAYLSSNVGRRQLRGRVHGTTSVAAIYWTDLKQVEIPVPPKEEQREIVDTLQEVDRIRRYNETYRNNLRRLKRGLMQDLLSGEVRTTQSQITLIDSITEGVKED